jgi:maltooligosyltrehalose trehalohydrolase
MPVQEFSGDWGWGYDGVDLFAPHHAYGGPLGLKRLVDACHAAGLAVLLDVVYNHLGPSGNYLGHFGPYFSDRYSSPWGPAINFDGPGSNEVRRFLCDNALMWLRDYHFDGLRIDAIHAMLDSSAVHFLEMLGEEVEQLQAHTGRNLALIAESNLNDPRVVTAREAGGYGLDAQWSDDFHHALHVALTGERAGYYVDFNGLADLAKSLRSVFVYDGGYSVFRERNHGRAPVGLSSSRFLGYLQNHDQVGNRAKGERSSQLMSIGKLKIGAALVLCAPFVPMLFHGEEFAASTPFCYFTQHPEPELGRAVSEGRRQEFAEFGWRAEEIPDPQDPSTFARSKLAWDELAFAPHAEMLEWYRRLIALRKAIPVLTDGRLKDLHLEFDEQAQWISMRREPICVIANLAGKRQAVPAHSSWEILLASQPDCSLANETINLPPESVVVLRNVKSKDT